MIMIPYGKQDISSADIKSVIDVLKSDFLTQGPVVPNFETAISAITTAQYVTAVNSATSALHIACLALGLSADDIVYHFAAKLLVPILLTGSTLSLLK